MLRELVNEGLVEKVKRGSYRILNPDVGAVRRRMAIVVIDKLMKMRKDIDEMMNKLGMWL
jgi:predicted transcriptional regulator